MPCVGIAKRGHYGSFLLADPTLMCALVHILHQHLRIPVTCKIRVLERDEDTIAMCRRLVDAGCSVTMICMDMCMCMLHDAWRICSCPLVLSPCICCVLLSMDVHVVSTSVTHRFSRSTVARKNSSRIKSEHATSISSRRSSTCSVDAWHGSDEHVAMCVAMHVCACGC